MLAVGLLLLLPLEQLPSFLYQPTPEIRAVFSWRPFQLELEPYLGFLHSIQYSKPSLVCDFQELYRYLIDDYLIERCRKLRKRDFVVVTDFMMRLKMGKRIHLCEYEADSLADGLNGLFNRKVEIPRIRHGKTQTFDTLINEEALLLAKYLRNEKKDWLPRIANVK